MHFFSGVLANFFNSLLSKKTGGMAGAGQVLISLIVLVWADVSHFRANLGVWLIRPVLRLPLALVRLPLMTVSSTLHQLPCWTYEKFLIDLNRLSFWQTSHLIWVPLSVSFCSKSACLHFVCVSLYFRNSVLNETNFVWCDEVLTDTVFPYRQGSCKVRCCCWAGPIDKVVPSLLIFTFLYKPPRTFAGIRRSLFRTQARQRERWWTVRSLPPARTADFLAAVWKLQASCDIQVTRGFPNVRGNVWETLEKCYFKCSNRGFDASLKEHNQPVKGSPP